MMPFPAFTIDSGELFYGGTPSYWFRLDAGTSSTDSNTKNTVTTAGEFKRWWNFGQRTGPTLDMTGNFAGSATFGVWVGASPSYYKGDDLVRPRIFGVPNPDYNEHTFFAVCKITATPSTAQYIDVFNANNNVGSGAGIGITYYNTGTEVVWGVGNNISNSGATTLGTASNINQITLISCYTSGGVSNVRINQTPITSTFFTNSGSAINNFYIGLSKDLQLMELIYYDGDKLELDDVERWEDYLNSKWL